ncbi:MAG: extracellular solute-binding protein [Dehalococcoidia bacterium]
MKNQLNRRDLLKIGGGAAAASLIVRPALAQSQTSLSYWHNFTSQSEFAALAEITELFEGSHPGYSITQESIPNADVMSKYAAASIAGSLPDCGLMASNNFLDLLTLGVPKDISGKLEAWDRRPGYSDAAFRPVTADGKVYGVPVLAVVDWMYYRLDWFEEAGIDVPTNFDEFREAAIRLTDPERGRYGFGMRGGAGGHLYVTRVLDSFGAFTEVDGKFALDRDKAIAAMDWWTGLYTRDNCVPPSAPNDSFGQIMNGFHTGQTAMLWHTTSSFVDTKNMLSLGEQFATAQIPTGPEYRCGYVGYIYNAVMSDDAMDSAWEWVKYWGEPEAALAYLRNTGAFPAAPSAMEEISKDPFYKPATDTFAVSRSQPDFAGFAGWGANTLLPEFQRVLIGESTVEQCVDAFIAGLDYAAD